MIKTFSLLVAAASILAGPAMGATATVDAYPATFFASSQPSSAFDMIGRLPGFSFDGGDSEVRGFSGAAGNVLIDGKRPSSKQESLEAVLRRIPAGAVQRIELIRAGAAGIDMQGQALVANVVRLPIAQAQGRVEAGLETFRHGGAAPSLAVEYSRKSPDRLIELSASAAREVEDEAGEGPLLRFSSSSDLERAGRFDENQATDIVEAAAGYERPVGGGKFRGDLSVRRERTGADILETATFPEPARSVVAETEIVTEGEAVAQYDRALGSWRSELRGLHHQSRLRSRDVEVEDGETSVSSLRSIARESIVRGVMRREGPALGLDVGGEAALNVLDSASHLSENGVAIVLPSATVRVEERRAEAFATMTWRPSPSLALEVGSRFEVSELSHAGDAQLTKSFAYAKPNALVTWSPTARDRIRLELARRVGQLDFEDFVSSASLTSDTVTAGNPDLAPDRTWRAAFAWERQVGSAGSVVLTLRRDLIEDVVDRIPIAGAGFAFDAPGNIGKGRRTEFEINAKLPVDRLGVAGGLVRADVVWRRSRVTDPATGLARGISDEPAVEGAVSFSQDLPSWRARWGVEATIGETEYEFRFDEVERERIETRYDLFAEYRPSAAWRMRVKVENLGSGKAERRRERYQGLRGSAPLGRIEARSLDSGPSIGVTLERTLGG
ncbi:TonB-dependent receptor plug domain-containing protein [Phenylobacterium sp.]|uniref:TonB-dependent receptor plug domain-containing protein n=1 Tax=Phenylobacterium sp. TaxID=1871053 RepID=UPI002FC9330D